MKENNIMKKEKLNRVIEILDNLTLTIDKMSIYDGVQNKVEMFTVPRAKRSDLIGIKKSLIKKYNLK